MDYQQYIIWVKKNRRNLNVISHTDCLTQLNKLHKSLSLKENEIIEITTERDDYKSQIMKKNEEMIKLQSLINDYKNNIYKDLEIKNYIDICDNYKIDIIKQKKEIERLKKYENHYNNIIVDLTKYGIYGLEELFLFLDKYHVLTNSNNEIVQENMNINIEKVEYSCKNIICEDTVDKQNTFCNSCLPNIKQCKNCNNDSIISDSNINLSKIQFLENNISSRELPSLNIEDEMNDLMVKDVIIDENINKYIKDKHILNIYIIMQFYVIFDKYLHHVKSKPNKNTFSNIIDVLYKGKLSYSNLYKIKSDDYEELKEFFHERIIINYNGNKFYLLDIISKYININDNTSIFDLFTGSMSISYYLKKEYPRNKLIINDNNKNLFEFYCSLKNNKNELIQYINSYNHHEYFTNYKQLLEMFNSTSDLILKSSLFYILNKIAFNSNMFYDKNSKLNITLNKKYTRNKICINEDILTDFSEFLAGIETNNLDVLKNTEHWINEINQGYLVIIDPPYDYVNNTSINYGKDFRRKQQEELFMFIEKLNQKGAKLILFNNDTVFIKNLYRNYNYDIIKSYKSIKRKYNTELLIYN